MGIISHCFIIKNNTNEEILNNIIAERTVRDHHQNFD